MSESLRKQSEATPGRQILITVIFLTALCLIWELSVKYFNIPGYILPAPSDIGAALAGNVSLFATHTLATVWEILLGLTVGTVLGLVLAVLMSQSKIIGQALYIPVLATQTTPTIAIAPILIIWFGVGLAPKIIVIAIFSFFPVLVNTLSGLQATGRRMEALMESVAASRWQTYRYVRIPMALPHVFAGFRLAAAAAVIGAVVVEWVASTEGLGYLLILQQSRLNIDMAFATLTILMALGILVFVITVLLESRLSWAKRLGVD